MKHRHTPRSHTLRTAMQRLLLTGCAVGLLTGCALRSPAPESERAKPQQQTNRVPASSHSNADSEDTAAATTAQAVTTAQTVAPDTNADTDADAAGYVVATQSMAENMAAGSAVLDLRQPLPPFTPRTIERTGSRWTAAPWESLPGLHQDNLHDAINALLQSCQASRTALPQLCAEAQTMQHAGSDQQLKWLQIRLQPYRIQARNGSSKGLLTAYYEPVLQASRLPNAQFSTPLYAPPAGLRNRRWYSRRQIESNPRAMQALRGRELVYLSSPIDALILHIQGSGRVLISEPDGSTSQKRMAFAGTNRHRYRSVATRLLRSGRITGASWSDIRAWADSSSPQAVQKMLWNNPRYVFFREEPLDSINSELGPRGAQGVPLTAHRSIAVDPASVPYGTPLWLASAGSAADLRRLVVAQDTGNAIRGAVRADYFAGSGNAAGAFAGRIKQPLALWALWPR